MEMIDSSHSLDKEKIHGLTVNRNRNYLAKKMIWRPNILACNDPDTWKIFDLFYANMQFFHTALLGKQRGNILYKIYLATGDEFENETQNVVRQIINENNYTCRDFCNEILYPWPTPRIPATAIELFQYNDIAGICIYVI